MGKTLTRLTFPASSADNSYIRVQDAKHLETVIRNVSKKVCSSKVECDSFEWTKVYRNSCSSQKVKNIKMGCLSKVGDEVQNRLKTCPCEQLSSKAGRRLRQAPSTFASPWVTVQGAWENFWGMQ